MHQSQTPTPLQTVVVAVDGPSGSGKSSVSRGVAVRLGLRYLDTGAMYRAVTWWMLEHGVATGAPDVVAAHAGKPELEVGTDPETPTIAIDGVDVSGAIRTREVTAAVSAVSAVPEVRRRLVVLQRGLIGDGGIVVEGRDIGTVVAPEAPVKAFLTASTGVRAERRRAEFAHDPVVTLDDTHQEITRRDSLDSRRAASPLAKAIDAHEIDATDLTLEQVIDVVVRLVLDRAAS
ncbi:MAG: (d)CMP kinase [Carbonactinosporaceae bacterium]